MKAWLEDLLSIYHPFPKPDIVDLKRRQGRYDCNTGQNLVTVKHHDIDLSEPISIQECSYLYLMIVGVFH